MPPGKRGRPLGSKNTPAVQSTGPVVTKKSGRVSMAPDAFVPAIVKAAGKKRGKVGRPAGKKAAPVSGRGRGRPKGSTKINRDKAAPAKKAAAAAPTEPKKRGRPVGSKNKASKKAAAAVPKKAAAAPPKKAAAAPPKKAAASKKPAPPSIDGVVKSGRGRPPGSGKKAAAATPAAAKKTKAPSPKSGPTTPAAVKRGRGRPPGSGKKAAAAIASAPPPPPPKGKKPFNSGNAAEPVAAKAVAVKAGPRGAAPVLAKRGPGRPPSAAGKKTAVVTASTSKDAGTRPRGRPPAGKIWSESEKKYVTW